MPMTYSIEDVKKVVIERFWSKIHFAETDECWIWMSCKNPQGYGVISLYVNNKWRTQLAHRALYLALVNADPALSVLHKCDNPLCCNPNHSFLGTRQDNMVDKVKKRRQRFGEKVWFAKLKNKDIPVIKSRVSNGDTQSNIAFDYNIDPSAISRIKGGTRWKEVQRSLNSY